jgi:GT2 family glycosyltransferase
VVSVIVACTRPHLVPGIADALAAQDPDGACELLVGGDVEPLRNHGFPVPTSLVEADPRDLHGIRRSLVGVADGHVLAFLDDDACPSPGWLAAAVSCGAGGEICTGPETPTRSSPGAVLAHRVASSWIAEGYRGHVETADRPLRWHEVPFCNLVLPRGLLEEVGLPESGLDWDVDDFDLCRRAASRGIGFRNLAALRIAHDRYPDRLGDWFGRKWRERRRTGEKLVAHPRIYLRLPGVVAAAVAPALLGAGLFATRRRPRVRLVALAGYLLAVLVASLRQGCRGRDVLRFAGAVIGLHLTTVAAVQVGIVDGVRRAGR